MKKSIMKKIAMLFCATTIIGSVAGCSTDAPSATAPTTGPAQTAVSEANSDTDKPLFSEPVTLSMYTASHASWPFQKDWYVIDLVKEKTNVSFDINSVDTEGFTEKLNLIMASGDLPDLIYMMDSAAVQQYGSQGAYVNLLEHMDQMPNFKKWYDENTAYALSYLSPDGALYMAPQHGVQETNRRIWMYRADVFEKLGLKVPTNQEEFYDVLVKIKEAYPDSYPLGFRSFTNGLPQLNMIAPSWGTSFINGEDNTFLSYNYDSKEWVFGPTQDSFREMIAFYHKLYQEELMIPNFLTIDTKGWQDVMANSDSFITLDYLSRIDFFNKSMRESQPDFNMAYMAPPSFGSEGTAKMAYSSKFVSGFSISSKSKKLDEALAYIDWQYSDEAYELLSWGRPDELYTVQADGTRKWNNFNTAAEMKQGTGLQTYGFYSRYNFDGERSTFSPECLNASTEAIKYDLPAQPVLSFNEDERAVLETIGMNIETHCTEQISKFLLGERSMDEWDAFIAEVQKMGLDDLKRVHESSYTRVLEAME